MMKIQIVDTNDHLIDIKDSNELILAQDIYRVSALWLTNSRGDILIAQRALSLTNAPGLWGPAAAGTIEEGETYEENIYKEAEEEIGLLGVKFKVGPKPLYDERGRHFFNQWFTATVDRPVGDFVLSPGEVAAVRWVSAEDLIFDMQENPDQYLPLMPTILETFS